MTLRRFASLLLVLLTMPLALTLSGCSALQTIAITPASGTVVLTAVGQTAQFNAIGSSQQGSAIATTSNITSSVTWSTSNPSVATISATGLATARGAGYTQILAESGGITATSDMTVNIASSPTGTTGGTITSLQIIPGDQAVSLPGQTGQFIAIGTSSTGATSDLTGQVIWRSSSTQIATVGSATGLATAVARGTATMSAVYTNTGGAVVTGTSTFTVTGGTTQQFTAVSLTPSTQSLSASGQTSQFIAIGTSGTTGLQQDVTTSSQIKWSSSSPSIVTVSASGLATGVSVGNSTITAELTNSDGSVVSGSATINVSITPPVEPLLSLTIVPASLTVGNLQDTGQFLAIGTYATAPFVRDLTNSPDLTWISASPSVFTVNSNTAGNSGATAGIVTAYGNGSGVIIAEATAADGTIQTATATFNCPLVIPTPTNAGSCYPGSQAPALLATITVYNEGLNTTNWEVTAPSATGTPAVLHCGPASKTGGSVCSATYPITVDPVSGAVIPLPVTLTAPATGAAFGGWSYNCIPIGTPTAAGPNSCTVNLSTNDTVGAIFN